MPAQINQKLLHRKKFLHVQQEFNTIIIMNYMEYGFGLFVQDITTVAQRFQLDLEHLQVEIFSPGRQAIFVETRGEYLFRIHLSLEEDRIVAVKQIAGPPVSKENDLFEKYKTFMK